MKPLSRVAALSLAMLPALSCGRSSEPPKAAPMEVRDAQDSSVPAPAVPAVTGTALEPMPSSSNDPPGVRRVKHSQLCVTSGRVEQGSTPGHLAVTHPKTRCTLSAPTGQVAEIHFTYLGPTDHDTPLGSGEMRRQIGLKLRAANSCNVVYAMWRIEPESKLVVSVKRNPGMRTSKECQNHGYTNIKPRKSSPVPVLTPGASHVMRAEMAGEEVKVTVDGSVVWEGALGPESVSFDGPVGIRTDNGRFDIELFAAQDPAAPPPPCGGGETSDEP